MSQEDHNPVATDPLSAIEDSPFDVEPPAPLWKSLPIFILFLPWTLFFLFLGLLTGLIFIPIFPRISMGMKDWSSRFCNKCLLLSLRMPVRVRIDEPRVKEAKLFVAPHTCLFENVVLLAKIGHFRPVTAEFTKSIPIFNKFADALDPLYVVRGKDAKGGLVKQLSESVLAGVYRHLVFPEGTYSNGKHLLQFKTGAFVSGAPIAPVAISFPEYTPFWNREESSFGVQIYRVVSRFYTPVDLHFLPLYEPSEEEKNNPTLYAENVRIALSKATGRTLSQYELKDSPNFKIDVAKSKQK